MAPSYDHIRSDVERIAATAPTVGDLMTEIVTRLQHIPAFNWVGFYMIERGRQGEPERMLVLGPFIGKETPHTRIPLNQGICGAAASGGKTVVVDDVNSDPRYLACSIETRSEIVVPVRARDQVVGELDIDSHTTAAFHGPERALVERCAELVGRYLEQHKQHGAA